MPIVITVITESGDSLVATQTRSNKNQHPCFFCWGIALTNLHILGVYYKVTLHFAACLIYPQNMGNLMIPAFQAPPPKKKAKPFSSTSPRYWHRCSSDSKVDFSASGAWRWSATVYLEIWDLSIFTYRFGALHKSIYTEIAERDFLQLRYGMHNCKDI